MKPEKLCRHCNAKRIPYRDDYPKGDLRNTKVVHAKGCVMPYPPTPTLNKMQRVKERSQAIGEFLDIFCRRKGYVLCKDYGNHYAPVPLSIEKLLAQHFKINLNKVEAERQAILEHLRQ